jgi:hypothetical protein
VPNNALHSDRGRIPFLRDTTPSERPRQVNVVARRRKGVVDMSGRLLPWVFIVAWGGAAYGGAGYDPESDAEMVARQLPGLVSVAGFGAVVIFVQTLLLPVICLINEGRCDWRKVRTGAVQWIVFGALMIALMFAGVGAYRLAGGVSGGWPGGLLAGAVGALIGALLGAALGVAANFVAAWLGNPFGSAIPIPALLHQADNGRWTSQQLALVLTLFGVIAVLVAIKCLVFGPPPYSRLAYVIGPCLIVAGYLVNKFLKEERDKAK